MTPKRPRSKRALDARQIKNATPFGWGCVFLMAGGQFDPKNWGGVRVITTAIKP